MKKIFILWIPFILALILPASASPKIITLKDGTRVNGQITSVHDGTYTVQTSVFGVVSIREDDITSITTPGAPSATEGTGNTPNMGGDLSGQIQAIQARIMSNPDTMMEISQLLNDPQIVAATQDPNFVAAIQSGDSSAVQSSPYFQKLMNNPDMQRIINQLKGEQ
jgi:hypothetical protein